MSILDKVRKWIDGETAELVLEEAARDAQVKPHSKAEGFIVKIARAVEEVMQRELVPLPQGTAIIPTEYTIFLSDADDKEWQGAKKRGLEQGLYHILSERAKELAGARRLETASFIVQFRVDGTLEPEEVRVSFGWEDTAGPKTQVLRKPTPGAPAQDAPLWEADAPQPVGSQPFAAPPTQPPHQAFDEFGPIPGRGPSEPVPNEEMTRVGVRGSELFKLEIWRGGFRHNVIPVYARETVVGRGSPSRPVDVALPGDPEVSRRQLLISVDASLNVWLTNEGRNPILVNGTDIFTGQRVMASPGMQIVVSSYMLRIQSGN